MDSELRSGIPVSPAPDSKSALGTCRSPRNMTMVTLPSQNYLKNLKIIYLQILNIVTSFLLVMKITIMFIVKPSPPMVSGPTVRATPEQTVSFTCKSHGFSPRNISLYGSKMATDQYGSRGRQHFLQHLQHNQGAAGHGRCSLPGHLRGGPRHPAGGPSSPWDCQLVRDHLR